MMTPYYACSVHWRCFGLLLVALSCALAMAAEGKRPKPDRPPKDTNTRVQQLIEQLASPNQAPKWGRKGERVFPENWDHQAQKKVQAARGELMAMGPDAFAELVKHFDDRRYCCTVEGPSAEENRTVGEVCGHIVNRWIDVTEGFRFGGRLKSVSWTGKEGASRFLERHKEKPLYELQAIAVENKIREVQSEDFKKWVEYSTGAELDDKKFASMRDEWVADLTKVATDLRSSKTPSEPQRRKAPGLGLDDLNPKKGGGKSGR